MKERVSTIVGQRPIILVAPHGADDTNTDILTELTAKTINCYAVINRGFERADSVDVNKDKADCNKITHCKQDVVFEEFLKPILKFKDRIIQKSILANRSSNNFYGNIPLTDPVSLFFIHGCGDIVHKEAGEKVALIVGYGRGTKKDSFSCDLWRKNLFVDFYRHFSFNKMHNQITKDLGDVYEGRGGSRYAGRDSDNLNQYFRKHEMDTDVHSMQLEFPYSFRNSIEAVSETASLLANVLEKYNTFQNYKIEPLPKFI
jgi:hypothetical protein